MALRTPRRRISPRTKRRYQAIKKFLRRALGTSSQPDIKINSSIAINVSDLKHKILGLEQQLHEVSKHCQDLICIESSTRRGTDSFTVTNIKHEQSYIKEPRDTSCDTKSHETETKVLYKTAPQCYIKSEDSDNIPTLIYRNENHMNVSSTSNNMNSDVKNAQIHTIKKKNRTPSKLHEWEKYDSYHSQQETHSGKEKFDTSTSSYHSVTLPRCKHPTNIEYSKRKPRSRNKQKEYIVPASFSPNVKRKEEKIRRHKSKSPHHRFDNLIDDKYVRKGNHMCTNTKLDQDFIADIIKRQYRPIKMFGKRESDISQFSAPICRDQEFSIHENIEEGSELCSCCVDSRKRYKYVCYNDLSDMRSICDTRLYSSKRHRANHHRRHFNDYNDCTLYDLIPVKEKSSPKTRRKFMEDNMTHYVCNREVPPSPRTHRPRLNLKAQYYNEYADHMVHTNQYNRKLINVKGEKEFESDVSQLSPIIKNYKRKHKVTKNQGNVQTQDDAIAATSGLQYRETCNDQANVILNENSFNKTQETDLSLDKTDKTINEIKDLLQKFLQEIKKESVESQCGGSDISKTRKKQTQSKTSASAQNSGHNFNNFSIPTCMPASPFLPTFPSNCCYPILPMCPMNCMQSGYIVPSTSFTCAACHNVTKETISPEINEPKITNTVTESSNPNKISETDDLIKEIYNFVSHNSNPFKKKGGITNSPRKEPNKLLTTRSAGTSRISRHDAQVGTLKTKCYSKSCEAIGSKMISDTYHSNASYSDTILDHLSLEATHSNSESEFTSESTAASKMKGNKFSNILRTFGLLKKKKQDVIEELSESESAIEVDLKPKRKKLKSSSPYRQDFTNYMIHGQEFYQRLPLSIHSRLYDQRLPAHAYTCRQPTYNPKYGDYNNLMHHHSAINNCNTAPPCASHLSYATAPPYPDVPEQSCHSHIPPQVPLCLKEIEVKSIGTQSEKKISFFTKLTQKRQFSPPPALSDQYHQRNFSTQTALDKTGLFTGWKNLQAQVTKTKTDSKNIDPFNFQFKTQKKLAEGDTKMRNAMLKKLFYKRNPFSPRNLIVRTLLGKDRSSWGEAPAMYRPRFFI